MVAMKLLDYQNIVKKMEVIWFLHQGHLYFVHTKNQLKDNGRKLKAPHM